MTIQYVGAKTGVATSIGSGDTTVSLTNLTGGLASSPSEGDLIVVAYHAPFTSNLSLVIETAGGTAYTLVDSELYVDDTYDSNLRVAYRFAGATPDTSFVISHNAGATTGAIHVAVSVWRNVDASTPLDVAAVPATGTNTGRPDPASITPTTANAVVLVFGAGASAPGSTPASFTSSDVTGDFRTNGRSGTSFASSCIGFGYHEWTSGAFNPAAFGGGSNTSSDSWTAMTLALRPLIASGTASITLEAATTSATGALQAKAAAAFTLGAATLAGTGAVQAKGSVALTLSAATLSAAGAVQAKAQTSGTLADAALVATGTVLGGNMANITLAGVGLTGRQADVLSFTIPLGVDSLTFTFDDLSTQTVSAFHGSYTVDPASLNRPRIRTIAADIYDGVMLSLNFVGPNPALDLDFTTQTYGLYEEDPSSPDMIIACKVWSPL